jgi:ABC-2 type transport system ATP-binding protein
VNSVEDDIVSLVRALPRRARAANLPPIDLTLGAGVHALVGTPADGTLAIAKLVGGFEPSASGKVLVAGRDPARDPDVRGRIGATLDVPCLPRTGRVHDLLADVDALRGGGSVAVTLATMGLSHWADRKLEGLSRWELRALDLAIALGTRDVCSIVLTEPGADIAPFDRQALRAALWKAGNSGACVIVVTASMSDAIELAGAIHLFERGRVTRWVPVDETGGLVPGRGVELRVDVDLPRLLVAALADDPGIVGIEWDEQRHRSLLSIRGADLDVVALALARATIASGASVRSIAPVAPQLDEVRAAASGLALAAYQAAYQSYVASAAPRPAPFEGSP